MVTLTGSRLGCDDVAAMAGEVSLRRISGGRARRVRETATAVGLLPRLAASTPPPASEGLGSLLGVGRCDQRGPETGEVDGRSGRSG